MEFPASPGGGWEGESRRRAPGPVLPLTRRSCTLSRVFLAPLPPERPLRSRAAPSPPHTPQALQARTSGSAQLRPPSLAGIPACRHQGARAASGRPEGSPGARGEEAAAHSRLTAVPMENDTDVNKHEGRALFRVLTPETRLCHVRLQAALAREVGRVHAFRKQLGACGASSPAGKAALFLAISLRPPPVGRGGPSARGSERDWTRLHRQHPLSPPGGARTPHSGSERRHLLLQEPPPPLPGTPSPRHLLTQEPSPLSTPSPRHPSSRPPVLGGVLRGVLLL